MMLIFPPPGYRFASPLAGFPAPRAHVTVLGPSGFAVTLDGVSGYSGTTLRLETRAPGSGTAWTVRASTGAPAIGLVLTASGLSTDATLEWRVSEIDAGNVVYDGTHGLTTPSGALWATLTATVSTALEGQGLAVSAITVGRVGIENPPDVYAVIRTLEEKQQGGSANNAERWIFPVEVELRFIVRDQAGELQKPLVEDWQRRLEAALHEKHAKDFPGIPGLESARVEVTSKDTAGSRDIDDAADEVRARSVVRFAVWRAR